MVKLPLTPLASPLRIDDAGVVRIGATRITLDTLVASYRDGNTAEEFVEQYPTLGLPDVHATIAYYLTHRAEVEAYLREREHEAAEIRREVEQASSAVSANGCWRAKRQRSPKHDRVLGG
jgi:uncharacterized protein (DUF433 family)